MRDIPVRSGERVEGGDCEATEYTLHTGRGKNSKEDERAWHPKHAHMLSPSTTSGQSEYNILLVVT